MTILLTDEMLQPQLTNIVSSLPYLFTIFTHFTNQTTNLLIKRAWSSAEGKHRFGLIPTQSKVALLGEFVTVLTPERTESGGRVEDLWGEEKGKGKGNVRTMVEVKACDSR